MSGGYVERVSWRYPLPSITLLSGKGLETRCGFLTYTRRYRGDDKGGEGIPIQRLQALKRP